MSPWANNQSKLCLYRYQVLEAGVAIAQGTLCLLVLAKETEFFRVTDVSDKHCHGKIKRLLLYANT